MKSTAFALLIATVAVATVSVAGAPAFADGPGSTSAPAFAQDYADNDSPMLTTADLAQLRAERDAARMLWASMTPEQRAVTKQTARQKHFAELTALDMMSDDDTVELSGAEYADLKAQMATARAKWNSLSPEEQAAMKKKARQMRLAELTQQLKVAGSGS